MSDSIFDLKQTLFTSNLPVPAVRDRGPYNIPDFDQALHSAQQQKRNDPRANQAPETSAARDNTIDDPDQVDDTPRDAQDEVTLSKQATQTTNTKSAEAAKGKKTKSDNDQATDGKQEPAADEIAAAVVATQALTKPDLKETPQAHAEFSEQPEGLELNDAVSFGSKRGRFKSAGNEVTATTATNNGVPAAAEDLTTTSSDAAAAQLDAVVVAAELHAAKSGRESKGDSKGSTKPGNNKTSNNDPNRTVAEADKAAAGEHQDGALAVTLTPDAGDETPATKRRLETTQQTMPEVHESVPQTLPAVLVNAQATANATSTEPLTEAAASSVKTLENTANSSPATESPTPPNHQRTPQVPGSFANRLEAASAERSANDGLNGVDRTRFVQRVARAFQRAGETEGEIRLRLSPPELGAVKLEVSLRDGAMIARLETETTTARNLLMDNLPQLKEKLAEQNVRIETFEVEVRDQSRQDGAEDAKEQLREQHEQQRNRLRGERATAPVVAAPIVQTLSTARQSSQLNVII
jgi:flagellar hook-length control protein FliK